ncbi:hypothetical protein [Nannocystis sp. SCPEA4]|uniref:hypothetical protein n=1 Tax=Nannocystis sp. SCPEA4 TaxID=2996787 RepID=UPI00226F9195|nr:hypothetical protein [Nannocystis sp. SCPEA4]MCY1056760.1 hypothetical protein [Nannocystis sp. SCPEA4]
MASVSRFAALGLVLGGSFIAREAAGCLDLGDPCGTFDTWTMVEEVFTAPIPIDGVIVMRVSGPSGAAPTADILEVEVTLDGMALTGAVEDSGIDGVLLWRPELPLTANSTLVVAGTIHNVEFVPNLEFCGEEFVPFEFEVEVAGEPMPPLELPAIMASEALEEPLLPSLVQLVCCDGAFPRVEFAGCGPSELVVDEGHCAPLDWVGAMQVEVRGTAIAAPGAASMIAAELRADGKMWAPSFSGPDGFVLRGRETEPFCGEVALRNLASGEEVVGPLQCHGDALVTQLGPQTLTPESPALAACVGQPYVCEMDELESEWDPDRCAAWPAMEGSTGEPTTGAPTTGPVEPGTTGATTGATSDATSGATTAADDGLVEHGCACASGSASWRDAWALPVLAGLRRRRRDRIAGRLDSGR